MVRRESSPTDAQILPQLAQPSRPAITHSAAIRNLQSAPLHNATTRPDAAMSTTSELTAQLQRVLRSSMQRQASLEKFLATQPQEISCPTHPHVMRAIDIERSQRATFENQGRETAGYASCPACVAQTEFRAQNERLRHHGVPEILLHSTFANWTPRTEGDESHLTAVRSFASLGVGFLVMVGNVGTGKSHLAVACMRSFRHAIFIKQSTLLRRLRATYRDAKAEDPIEQCQHTGLLVVDEMGLSSGGRDELPMLHEILDHRHGERLPTILTGNLTLAELRDVIGERLSDRLHESAAGVLTFGGTSHRASRRSEYFTHPDAE